MLLLEPHQKHLPGIGVMTVARVVGLHEELVGGGVDRLALMRIASGRCDESQQGPKYQQDVKR
jgi:hypothetical protein